MAATSFTDLRVWQASHRATLEVYRITRSFPAEERFGLSIQMRRAAVSIGANIAEGFGRRRPRDKARLYNIGEGSAEDLKNLLLVARDLGYAKEMDALWKALEDISRMLRGLVDKTLDAPVP
ncbi:MAG TPA: four helix bundle protein [Planctomycetota bacterium]